MTSSSTAPPSHVDLEDRLDILWTRYLHLLDDYTQAQSTLQKHLSAAFFSLASANFKSPHGRYGQDHYDDRVVAITRVQTDALEGVNALEIKATEDRSQNLRLRVVRKECLRKDKASEAEELDVQGKPNAVLVDDVKSLSGINGSRAPADPTTPEPELEDPEPSTVSLEDLTLKLATETAAHTNQLPTPSPTPEPEHSETQFHEANIDENEQDAAPDSKATSDSAADASSSTPTLQPYDPIRMFGILVPPALRQAQQSFTKVVMDDDSVSRAANALRQMREVEGEIRRLRKAIRKMEKRGE